MTAQQQSRGAPVPEDVIYNSSQILTTEKPSLDRSLKDSHAGRQSYKTKSNQKLQPLQEKNNLN